MLLERIATMLYRIRDRREAVYPIVEFGPFSIEPLAKFIERGEFSLCSRGGAAGAQAGAGLSCVRRSI
jgi:hypothetical protein